jgi:hypothetical protein
LPEVADCPGARPELTAGHCDKDLRASSTDDEDTLPVYFSGKAVSSRTPVSVQNQRLPGLRCGERILNPCMQVYIVERVVSGSRFRDRRIGCFRHTPPLEYRFALCRVMVVSDRDLAPQEMHVIQDAQKNAPISAAFRRYSPVYRLDGSASSRYVAVHQIDRGEILDTDSTA